MSTASVATSVTPDADATPLPGTTALTNDILIAIYAQYQRAACVQRINVIAGRIGDGRFVRSAKSGTADLLGVIRGRGVAIEVKRGRDRLSERQRNFREAWIRAGGIHVEARSVEQTMRDLEFGLGLGESVAGMAK